MSTQNTPDQAEAARLLTSLLGGCAATAEIRELRAEVTRMAGLIQQVLSRRAPDEDDWLDAKAARRYLAKMSPATFDKYRYETKVKIKGYRLDGKTMYKKSELDRFVMLYEVNSAL